MARSPIQHEMAGMATPRERIWASIRQLRQFDADALHITIRPRVHDRTEYSYLQALVDAGYLTAAKDEKTGRITYSLVRDAFEAPRINKQGQIVTQGLATLAMWRSMKALKEFDYHDIQRSASVGAVQVSRETAKVYLLALARAGYFRTVREAKPGTAARYRLVRDTGAHAPAITRRKCVFDRNTGLFTYEQPAQEVCDGLE